MAGRKVVGSPPVIVSSGEQSGAAYLKAPFFGNQKRHPSHPNTPLLAIEHTALCPQRDPSWPSNTPFFALKETPLGHRTHRSLPSKRPLFAIEHTILCHRTHHSLPSNTPLFELKESFPGPKHRVPEPENGENGQHLLPNQAHTRLNYRINADDARN
jgi:hypothetical protein